MESLMRRENGLMGIVSVVLLIMAWEGGSVFAEGAKLGDAGDGNLSVPVHRIKLYDEFGDVIEPGSESPYPFSVTKTCGQCHDIDTIRHGWHFNATDPKAGSGLTGEPWLYVDPQTRIQAPLSYRGWPGMLKPGDLGLSRWDFALRFGGHLPGGLGEDKDAKEPDFDARWMVSGELEINCLACHDADVGYDPAEYGTQVENENLRWAPTAACSFASVKGKAKDMGEFWDYTGGMPPDDPKKIPPTVSYDPAQFDADGKVLFDIRRSVPNEKCYFCHTTVDLTEGGQEKWRMDEDVHIAAGLSCVDCHRNGLDHMIHRGYEGENAGTGDDPKLQSLTCKGCHLGVDGEKRPYEGRLGAPRPEHKGIPTVHFERLTCTACHSGPWPGEQAHQVRTSRSHGLGLHNVNKSPEALPHIESVVFSERAHNRLGPDKLVWPAMWGKLMGDAFVPFTPEQVKEAAGDILTDARPGPNGDWQPLTVDQIGQVLDHLNDPSDKKKRAVYLAGGNMYRLDRKAPQGTIKVKIKKNSDLAQPCLWPIAHNVRPASQSLGRGGAKGCAQCHDLKSGFFFGDVAVDSPVAADQGRSIKRVELQRSVDNVYAKAFSWSFMFRPWMKLAVAVAGVILLSVLVLYGLKALAAVAGVMSGRPDKVESAEPASLPGWFVLIKGLIYLATAVCFVVLAVTGLYPWYIGERLSGYWLMVHATFSPVFGVCLALCAVLWAQQHRFQKGDWCCSCSHGRGKDDGVRPVNRAGLAQKVCFWIILISAVPLMLSILFSMLPLFGTEVQGVLFHVHRGSAAVICVFLLVHAAIAGNRRLKE